MEEIYGKNFQEVRLQPTLKMDTDILSATIFAAGSFKEFMQDNEMVGHFIIELDCSAAYIMLSH